MNKILVGTLTAFLVSLSGYVLAANYSNPMDGIFRGIYGDTISIEVPSLVSKSPVVNEDENGVVSFQLNASTGYKNFNQLSDLGKGDPVRVEYKEDPSGKIKGMVAVNITRIEPGTVTDSGNVTTVDNALAPTATQTITTTTTVNTKVNPAED